MKKEIPQGIELLFYIYLLNTVLYIISLALFENRILILGNEANYFLAWLVRLCLIVIPLYIAFRLMSLRKDAFFAAVLFHSYFLINNLSSFLESMHCGQTLVRITGLYGLAIYSPQQIFVIFLNSLLNILILIYLIYKREYFFKKD